MKLLVQTAQLVTREERGFEHSWPALKPGYEHHPLGMLLISFCHQDPSTGLFTHFTKWSPGPKPGWIHYITLRPLACAPESGKLSSQDFSTALGSVPTNRGRGTPVFAELGTDSLGGWSADGPKVLLDGFLNIRARGFGTRSVLWWWDQSAWRTLAPQASSPAPILPWPRSCPGQVYRFLWEGGGRTEEKTLDDPEISAGAPHLMSVSTHPCFLDRVFRVDTGPTHQALQPDERAEFKE